MRRLIDLFCNTTKGLENPGRFEISDVEGNTLDLVVGGSLSTGLDYVIMGEQYDAYLAGEVDVLTLLSYSHDAFGVLDIDYTTLLNRAIWIQNIHEVKTIIYDMAGTMVSEELLNPLLPNGGPAMDTYYDHNG